MLIRSLVMISLEVIQTADLTPARGLLVLVVDRPLVDLAELDTLGQGKDLRRRSLQKSFSTGFSTADLGVWVTVDSAPSVRFNF